MNKKDLKKLRIDKTYVISPERFLIRLGIEGSSICNKLTSHELHYILQKELHHAGIKNLTADKVYCGDIILIGTPNKFFPYYNPLRCKIDLVSTESKEQNANDLKITTIEECSMFELYKLYDNTDDIKYLDEIYDRAYDSIEEEMKPTKQKIHSKPKRR